MSSISIDLENIKYKPLTKERILISVDRLTRFKNPEEKYTRVFRDILTSNLITPAYKKSELENMDYCDLTGIAEHIINNSLKSLVSDYKESDLYINYLIQTFENSVFYIDENTAKLLNNSINYSALISLLVGDIPLNLRWLKMLSSSKEPITDSYKMGLKYPIKKLILCEGITEEILLPEFAKLLGYDFNKNGIQLISAGGKNQVVKLFYKFAEQLKIPIFVLLDSDAEQNAIEIEPKLRKHDKIYRIESGEFEDILPKNLVEKSLKSSIKNISLSPEEESDYSEGTVHYLEEFYRTRGAHEFKKAEFAHIVKENIAGISDVSDEFRKIISIIKDLS